MGKCKPKGKETSDHLELPGAFYYPLSPVQVFDLSSVASAREHQCCQFSGLMSQSWGISDPLCDDRLCFPAPEVRAPFSSNLHGRHFGNEAGEDWLMWGCVWR